MKQASSVIIVIHSYDLKPILTVEMTLNNGSFQYKASIF